MHQEGDKPIQNTEPRLSQSGGSRGRRVGGKIIIEPRSEKTGLRGFRPGPTQTGLRNHCIWLET